MTEREPWFAAPCGCAQTCGDDGDTEGPGVCKGLPRAPEPPLVEIVLVPRAAMNETASCFLHGDFAAALMRCPKCGAGRGSDTTGAAARNSRPTTSGWIDCPRCERQRHDVGACGLCGNLGVLDENSERIHCDCRADNWVEGDNGAIRCEQCGGYAGEPGTSITLVSTQVPACDRCSQGVMDTTNSHLLGMCECECHRASNSQPEPKP